LKRQILRTLLLLTNLVFASVLSAQTTGFVVSSDASSAATADRLYSVQLETGESSVMGSVGYEDVEGLALDVNGNLYGIDDATKTLVTINKTSGRAQAIGSNGNTRLALGENNAQDPSLAFSCSNDLYAYTKVSRTLYRANVSTGALEARGAVGSGAAASKITDMVFRGEMLFGLGEDALYTINLETGATTLVGAYGVGTDFSDGGGLAADAQGQLWAVAERRRTDGSLENSVVYKIDHMTGAATRVSSTLMGAESLAISSPVCTFGGQAPIAAQIPTLNAWGALALLLGLLLSGFWISRRS
jgi:hypothetical protein